MAGKVRRVRALLLISAVYMLALGFGLAVAVFLPFEDLLVAALCGDVAATLVVLVFSRITGNSSLYDPYWSVAPPVIAVSWLLSLGGTPAGTSALAIWLVLALLSIWAVRLTWNWVRRWKGPADEDWRYEMLKERFTRFDVVIDLFGIHLFPTLQVFLGLMPLYYFLERFSTGATPGGAGWIALFAGAAIMIIAIVIETIADRQLAQFRRGDGRSGLLDTGLWASIAHPNYVGEILFWWGLWVASLAGGAPLWTVLGPVAMTLMFLFVSVPMMDRHLRERSTPAN